jgi:chemotaxis protein CheX
MTTDIAVTGIPIQTEEMAKMLFAAAQEVFTSMLGSELRQLPEPPARQSDSFDGVLSLVGLAGSVIGNGSVVCTAESACAMSSRLLMTEFKNVDDEVLDALGEIANMVVGGFKNLLEPAVGRLQMSIPSVIYGKNIATRDAKAGVALRVCCEFPGGEFSVKVRLAVARE